MRTSTLTALLLAPLIGVAQDAYFFRIVSTQATHIVDFSPNTAITWSNAVAPALFQIEWTPDPRGFWLTNHFASTVSTTTISTCEISSVFSTGLPSTVLYQEINGIATDGAPGNKVDINADGTWDFEFRHYFLTNWQVTDELLDVKTEGPAVILTPYTNGQLIAHTPNPPDSWTVSKWSMNLGIRRLGDSDPLFTGGPWASITNAYLPVRMALSEGYHYGWIALEFQPEDGMVRIIISESGLNAVPGQPIRAGQK